MLEEGDDGEIVKPTAEPLDLQAVRIHNLLANGTGGIDWSGLQLWVEVFGIRDVEGLLQRLEIILTHRAPEEQVARIEDAD